MKPHIHILTLLALCSCNLKQSDPNSIFSKYVSEYRMPASGMTLHEDSTYICGFAASTTSWYDSGRFSMNGDTIYLKSSIEDQVDTTDNGHHQVISQTGSRFLLKNNRIYRYLENGKFDTAVCWLKKGLGWPRE